jgi:hypothetical protein
VQQFQNIPLERGRPEVMQERFARPITTWHLTTEFLIQVAVDLIGAPGMIVEAGPHADVDGLPSGWTWSASGG